MTTRYVEKKQSKTEDSAELFNLQVLQKQNKTVRRIEKTIYFGVLHKIDRISRWWTRMKCEGPLFLTRKDNSRLLIIFMNQLGHDNTQIDIGDHLEFELKKQDKEGRVNYFLNIKRPDSLLQTEYWGIWSEDPQLQELFQILQKKD